MAAPASAATLMPCSWHFSITSTGGEPSALAISTGRCFSATSRCERATECSQPRTPSRPSPSGQRRYAELEQRLVDELLVLLGDHRAEVDRRALGRDLHRHHDVDAVRLAVGVVVEPGQDPLELLGVVEPDAAEDAEAAGPRDRGGDVLGRGEREDRVLDPELVTEGVRIGQAPVGAVALAANEASASSLAAGYCALPVALRGISVDERQRARQLVAGQVRRAGTSRSSSSSSVVPSRSSTTAATAWPYFSSGTPTTRHVVDGRVALDRHLDLLGVDLLAAGVDAVGAAAEQRDPVALLDPGEVAGHRVALAVDLEEGRRRLLGVLVVADRHASRRGRAGRSCRRRSPGRAPGCRRR